MYLVTKMIERNLYITKKKQIIEFGGWLFLSQSFNCEERLWAVRPISIKTTN